MSINIQKILNELKKRTINKSVHIYNLFKNLSTLLDPNSVIISYIGCTLAWIMQSFILKRKQKFFHYLNNTAMGWSLPAIRGVFASKKIYKINCFVGDSSFMISIQELEIIRKFKIPVHIF